VSIRSPRRGPASLAVAACLLLGGGLLSGCGVSDDQLRPGVAAQVGDDEIGLDEIDETIEVACSFFVDQEQPGFPRSLARQQFVSALVQRSAAAQALEEAGLSVGADYQQAAGRIETENAQIPADQREPFVLLNEAAVFVDAAAALLGEAATEGEEAAPADPEAAAQAGSAEIASWIEANDVEINPVFRLTVSDGQVIADEGGASVPASDFARSTLLDPLTASNEQVAATADLLPPSQLCGAAPEA
jgi:hypothetical protein